ncbi:MAG TPA: hypothetical protein VNK82_10055 [Terriglobales bacterium]|nr:hypothetical protein [Terriglobales bacterium]
MTGLGFDLVPWMFHLLAAALLGFGWYRLLRPRSAADSAAVVRASRPQKASSEARGSTWRRKVLFLGYLGASISFLMYLAEFFVEFRYSNRSLYDRFSGAAMIPLFAALLVAIAGKGPGRILLVLAALLVFGLWLSIMPLRLF